MFGSIALLQKSSLLARHAALQQNVVSKNVANVDTPGYRAQKVSAFTELDENTTSASAMKVSRSEHISKNSLYDENLIERDADHLAKPNGNTVSLEAQMLSAIEAERQHSKAMAIYQNSMDILKISIGRGR
ncbi:FlgB family protein [Litoreibacter arenae]|uniref:Flagellar basal-body rod protein FlgB n=1 Tax=Litoreibacter arenae DSM 19593 TaxID=1123360 RepID=S9RGW2_9RHOB|nr:FlgB family protein [Litoreibacter arenae]EPX77335.1 Flagellar basal-body rod protein FlgB [Litoreibacter arenae DSM 19593]